MTKLSETTINEATIRQEVANLTDEENASLFVLCYTAVGNQPALERLWDTFPTIEEFLIGLYNEGRVIQVINFLGMAKLKEEGF